MKKARQKFYSISEAAAVLGISRVAVHRAIRQHRLEAARGTFEVVRVVKTKVKGWRISAKALRDYRVSELHQMAGKKID